MLRKALLTTNVAAAIALCVPGALTPAGAGNIKVPTVKVRPMVRPHIRPITPRDHVRVPTERLVKKKHRQRKRKQRRKQNDAARTAPVPSRQAIVVKPVSMPDVRLPPPRPDLADATRAATPSKQQASELAQIKGVKEAIEASKGVAELARVGHALGLPDPLHPDDGPDTGMPGQDNPAPDGPGLVTPGSRQFGDLLTGAGFDSALFDFLDNSHMTSPRNTPNALATGDAAKKALGVTPGRIAAAIGGVASGGGTRPHVTNVRSEPWQLSEITGLWSRQTTTYFSDGSRQVSIYYQYPNNTHSLARLHYNADGDLKSREYIPSPTGDVEAATVPGRVYGSRTGGHDEKPGSDAKPAPGEKPGKDVNKLYNPDYAGSGDHPFHWLNEKPKTMLDVITGISPGAMPQDPDSSQPVQSTTGTPIVSQEGLVSKYDPDSANGGGRAPVRPGDICMHSEC